jgi:uncharacterized membrane protein
VRTFAGDASRCVDRVAGTFTFGEDRTAEQDAAFAVQQLVEVALRALSPGINEPFTAIMVIDRLRSKTVAIAPSSAAGAGRRSSRSLLPSTKRRRGR